MWEWADEHKSAHFDVVTITPPWIFGPYATDLTSTAHLSESVRLYNLLGLRKYLNLTLVDIQVDNVFGLGSLFDDKPW